MPPNKTIEHDHTIDLIDNTRPPDHDSVPIDAGPEANSTKSEANLSGKWTKGKLKEELRRRRYSKWKEDNCNSGEHSAESSDHDNKKADISGGNEAKSPQQATRRGRLRDKISFRPHKKGIGAKKQENYEVDILYQNQRGFFFFGIPLYSAKTLLNFDPSQWQTSEFRDSPVNITNAQLPDPSWAWVSKSWYVDMSHDVDLEGWQYSFSFRQGFSWHGNHPWFHSFVRRRRWLRKRVKLSSGGTKGLDAHMLTVDYFTIHTKRDRSRGSSTRASSYNRSSYMESRQLDSDSEDDDEEISNVVALMKALKRTTVDRKKLGALQSFIEHGNDGLHCLPEYMPEIMAEFMYQSSCRQLLSYLQDVFYLTTEQREHRAAQNNPESETEKRRIDILLQAVRVADDHVKDLEYWSDVKAVSRDVAQVEPKESRIDLDTESRIPIDDSHSHSSYEESVIKGIPDSAGIGDDPGIRWARPDDQRGDKDTDDKGKGKGKGKGKAL